MKKLISWIGQNKHFWWSLFLPYILFMFFLPEHLVTANYWVSYVPLDDLIPFCPPFVIFYCLWFPTLFLTGLWLLIKDCGGFRRYMLFLATAYTISAAVYILFPNGQNLRPAVFPTQNIFTWLIGELYRADTNTNVLPSMHVVCALGVIFSLHDTHTIKSKWVRPAVNVLSAFIMISTAFIKQHSVLDIAAGLIYGTLIYALVNVLIDKKNRKGRG